MPKRLSIPAALVAGAGLLLLLPANARPAKQPVYVGARVCAGCHEGKAAGAQYSLWRLSKHAKAHAVLALPEAKAMAQLSGIPDPPEKAAVCLGCHATAADAEPWERDPGFVLEDGVQCERCHGPGSEYANARVMRDPEAARQAGLRMPTRRECQLCHYVKGSHVAVHKLPQLDLDLALKTIAHPVAERVSGDVPRGAGEAAPVAEASKPGPRFVGATACEKCHGASMGHQSSLWRMGPHARAYATLATQKATEIAKQEGVTGEAQQAPACLKCHTSSGHQPGAPANESFSPMEGVGCEACHGAGSEYLAEAIMRDRPAALRRGLEPAGRETCQACHAGAHGKRFDFETAMAKIAHPTRPPKPAPGKRAADALDPVGSVRYKTPLNLALSPDGKQLYVACEASGSVIVVDVQERRKVAEIPSGSEPADVAFSPDGTRAYVSNRRDDTVSVLDVAARRVVATITVGDEPHGLLTDRSGRTLYVLNTSSDNISVVDTASLSEVKRLQAGRYPWSLALSPDGGQIAVTNALSGFVKFRQPSRSELTLIDTGRAMVVDRVPVPEANLLLGVAWHPSGRYALFTLNRTKNLVPMTRILQGWTITNGLGVLWRDGRVDQVLLDEPGLSFADAFDVVFTPDGKRALVTSSGTDRLAVVDVEKLIGLLESASPAERVDVIPNHLGKSGEFVIGMIDTRTSPRGVLAADDGKTAWVANALDDSLTLVDLEKLETLARVDLEGPKEITKVRWGERLFNSANISFGRQFSCHSCHPDGHVDGLTYDIEADGIGVSPVDNRTLRGIYDTDPFKWEGTNTSLARQCGPRLAVFFTRIDPFTREQLEAVNDYTVTIARPPNRYRPVGAPLTDAQRRGKLLFERSHRSDGREIPLENRCLTCHFPPYFTDRSQRDVGTRHPLDRQAKFDVPHLLNIYDSAPYLHNGIADTLEEIWTRFNPYDKHGVTNDMTKDQLNDLIEYLKTL